MIAPMRISLQQRIVAKDWTPAVRAAPENGDEAGGEIVRNAVEWEEVARPCRVLDEKIVAVVAVVLAEGFDQQVVEWEPDRSSPVRVAAEQGGPRLGRFVGDRVHLFLDR